MADTQVIVRRCPNCLRAAAWNCGKQNCPIRGHKPVFNDRDKPHHKVSGKPPEEKAPPTGKKPRNLIKVAIAWVKDHQEWFIEPRSPLAFERHMGTMRNHLQNLSYQDACKVLRQSAELGYIRKMGLPKEPGRLYYFIPDDPSDKPSDASKLTN